MQVIDNTFPKNAEVFRLIVSSIFLQKSLRELVSIACFVPGKEVLILLKT